MRLQEYQVKRIFREYGIPVPKGEVASTISEVVRITQIIAPPVILKAQVLTKNRSRFGGIRLAKSVTSANEITTEMFGIEINHLPVEKVLVEAALDIKDEYYLGIAVDYAKQVPVLISAAVTGTQIDELALNMPEEIHLSEINPLIGLRDFNIFSVLGGLELDRKYWNDFYELANSLWQVFVDKDAVLIEVNPLVETTDGYLIAVDGRMILDDQAIYRHVDVDIDESLMFLTDFQRMGRSYDLAVAEFDGQIGCLTNSRSLGKMLVDQFEDVPEGLAHCVVMEGNANASRVNVVLEMMAKQIKASVLLIMISSGFLQMNEIFEGVLLFMEKNQGRKTIVMRLREDEDPLILDALKQAGVFVCPTIEDAVEKAVSSVHFTDSFGENYL